MVLGGGLSSHQPASVHKAGVRPCCCRRQVWRRSGASGWCSVTWTSRWPPAGTLTWDGADALADLPLHARRLAYVGHQDAVKPALTVTENLTFTARIGGGAVRAALAAMGLEGLADLPARMLSAGQRRRLALARLTLSRAPLWLLDEPTLGLDTASVERFGAMLNAHRASNDITIAAPPPPPRGGWGAEWAVIRCHLPPSPSRKGRGSNHVLATP